MKLKEKLTKKLKKSGGFTLIEMLIVVAIIAILVAVSVPMVNANLEEARKATDAANLRAAKTVAILSAVEGTLNGEADKTITAETTYVYDISEGKIIASAEKKNDDLGKSNDLKNKYITIVFAATSLDPKVEWGTVS